MNVYNFEKEVDGHGNKMPTQAGYRVYVADDKDQIGIQVTETSTDQCLHDLSKFEHTFLIMSLAMLRMMVACDHM